MYVYCYLSAHISLKPQVQISPNFLYVLPVAMAQSSSDDTAICHVLPVLWMTSFIHIKKCTVNGNLLFHWHVVSVGRYVVAVCWPVSSPHTEQNLCDLTTLWSSRRRHQSASSRHERCHHRCRTSSSRHHRWLIRHQLRPPSHWCPRSWARV